jgi:methylisocitrate lyase
MTTLSSGAKFRAALAAENPLQVIGAISAYTARMAERTGFKALYLSGGGVAANSLGMPDLGISALEDVLVDVPHHRGHGAAFACRSTRQEQRFHLARTIRSMIKAGAGACAEDQFSAKRCRHRPARKQPGRDSPDRIKAMIDARADPDS